MTEEKQKITREEVVHVADLARLELSEDELVAMTGNMNRILEYMDKLNGLDTSGMAAMTHAVQLQNVTRSDESTKCLDREEALAAAPETDGVSFIVPKVF